MNSSKRQRILDGILEVVGAEGYEGTSVRTVLDRTGLYRQAFYDSFADKEDCYLQAYDATLARVETGVRAAAAGKEHWLGELRAGLGALLDFLDTEPDVARALIVEVHAAGEPALSKRAAAMQRACDFLDRARARTPGSGTGGAPPAIAPEAIASGIHMIVHTRLAAGTEGSLHRLLPEFMYIAALPYFGAAVAKAEMLAG